MKRATHRKEKSVPRSKKSQSRASTKKKKSNPTPTGRVVPEACVSCGTQLETADRALFVEEEVGRIFCSEECITDFFGPDIDRMERDYLKRVNAHANEELSGEEREKLAHLRWITLQEPDEVWREKTLQGDLRYTMISEFKPGNRRIWCVCICLALRGEPSFLYLAFPTASPKIVQAYRRGERIEWTPLSSKKPLESASEEASQSSGLPGEARVDGLAENWTESETLRAKLNGERSASDISPEHFGLYQKCLEETLETPDEVWSLDLKDNDGGMDHVFHFIKRYSSENPAHWYVVIARSVDSAEGSGDPSADDQEAQMELLDAFPTVDPDLVQQYRRGTQEVGRSPGSSGASGSSESILH